MSSSPPPNVHCLKYKTMSFPQAQPFWYRCVFLLIWAKVILYKYVSCWVIAVSTLLISRYDHEMCLCLDGKLLLICFLK